MRNWRYEELAGYIVTLIDNGTLRPGTASDRYGNCLRLSTRPPSWPDHERSHGSGTDIALHMLASNETPEQRQQTRATVQAPDGRRLVYGSIRAVADPATTSLPSWLVVDSVRST
jgi:hypothetical protein